MANYVATAFIFLPNAKIVESYMSDRKQHYRNKICNCALGRKCIAGGRY